MGGSWLLAALLATGLTAAGTAEMGDARGRFPSDRSFSPFLLKQTDAKTVITGPVAHVAVTQKWQNPNPGPVDGMYIFPLPENAAVTDMKLKIGDRTIESDMRRREEAPPGLRAGPPGGPGGRAAGPGAPQHLRPAGGQHPARQSHRRHSGVRP